MNLASHILERLGKSFHSKYYIDEKTECWVWTACIASHGYGDITVRSHFHSTAHRASWLLHKGDIPDNMFVLHTCDNRKCVNPDHLFLGTHKDNMRDMNEKGRQVPNTTSIKGSVSNAKLTEEDVICIRELRSVGEKLKSIAAIFDVHPDHIRKITNYKIWKDVA